MATGLKPLKSQQRSEMEPGDGFGPPVRSRMVIEESETPCWEKMEPLALFSLPLR